jgi:hypothetical protein
MSKDADQSLDLLLTRLRDEQDRAILAAGSPNRVDAGLSPKLPPARARYARWLAALVAIVIAASVGGAVDYSIDRDPGVTEPADALLGSQIIGPDEAGGE